ncbi:MAG: methylated-DNA--[protein]-cysteine S-methyltransferase [Geminicoccaceae bacterium]|nr:methylated-DNA--[protein]-cysteine S-methyltransferase [Geminicoccaceae bacterium]
MKLHRTRVPSPVGEIILVHRPDDAVIVHLDFEDCPERLNSLLARRFGGIELDDAPHVDGQRALDGYFEGRFDMLDRLDVDPGGTEFQNRLWLGLRDIRAGTTATYADMALRLGNPRAVRAVGRTNGLNPIALILPCHRVIGKDGSLTGYAGGLERKAWLLRHEGVLL